jgi:hypothetical protein
MLLTMGLVLSVCITDVMGENLVKYYDDGREGTVYFYDKDSVSQKTGIVKVWDVIRYHGINKDWSSWVDACMDISKPNSNPNCSLLATVKILNEINCEKHKYRLLSVMLFDENGRFIEVSSKQSDLKNIYPNTVIDELKRHVCK